MEWCSSYRSIEEEVKKLDTSVKLPPALKKLCSIGNNAGGGGGGGGKTS